MSYQNIDFLATALGQLPKIQNPQLVAAFANGKAGDRAMDELVSELADLATIYSVGGLFGSAAPGTLTGTARVRALQAALGYSATATAVQNVVQQTGEQASDSVNAAANAAGAMRDELSAKKAEVTTYAEAAVDMMQGARDNWQQAAAGAAFNYALMTTGEYARRVNEKLVQAFAAVNKVKEYAGQCREYAQLIASGLKQVGNLAMPGSAVLMAGLCSPSGIAFAVGAAAGLVGVFASLFSGAPPPPSEIDLLNRLDALFPEDYGHLWSQVIVGVSDSDVLLPYSGGRRLSQCGTPGEDDYLPVRIRHCMLKQIYDKKSYDSALRWCAHDDWSNDYPCICYGGTTYDTDKFGNVSTNYIACTNDMELVGSRAIYGRLHQYLAVIRLIKVLQQAGVPRESIPAFTGQNFNGDALAEAYAWYKRETVGAQAGVLLRSLGIRDALGNTSSRVYGTSSPDSVLVYRDSSESVSDDSREAFMQHANLAPLPVKVGGGASTDFTRTRRVPWAVWKYAVDLVGGVENLGLATADYNIQALLAAGYAPVDTISASTPTTINLFVPVLTKSANQKLFATMPERALSVLTPVEMLSLADQQREANRRRDYQEWLEVQAAAKRSRILIYGSAATALVAALLVFRRK